ncbi:glycosyltransferase [Enterococcus cecorum]|nr:glycosyltransferase [Enterococcus cecorum]
MEKKIMHLLQSDRFSGAENVVCQIIDLYKDEYSMVYVCPKGPIEETLKKRNIEYYLLDSFSQKEIDSAVNNIKPDIIHAHDFNASVRAAKYKCIVISHIHNNPLWLSKLDYRSFLYALCCRKYKYIIGVSESIRDEYIFKGLLDKKFFLLQNVVNKNLIIQKANDNYVEKFDLLYVGRLFESKNPIGFLEIVKQFKLNKKKVNCLMIGEGPLKEICEKYIEENELYDWVRMIGFTNNPYSYMKAAKVVVMPSKWEGFGLVAVEAMLLGKPVVCTPVGGLVDIIPNEFGCYAESCDEFVRIIEKLLTDEGMYRNIMLKAPDRVNKYADIGMYKDKLDEIYISCLGKRESV